MLDLFSRNAARMGSPFQSIPPERLALDHMLCGHKKNRGDAERLEQGQGFRVVVVSVVKGYKNVFAGRIQSARNVVGRDKGIGVFLEVIQEPPKHLDCNSSGVGWSGVLFLCV